MIPKYITDNAACRGHHWGEFYFYESATKDPVSLPPDHICFKCPVIEECKDWGLHHESHGTWGGMTESELYYMRKHLGIPQPPSGIGVIVINGRPQ